MLTKYDDLNKSLSQAKNGLTMESVYESFQGCGDDIFKRGNFVDGLICALPLVIRFNGTAADFLIDRIAENSTPENYDVFANLVGRLSDNRHGLVIAVSARTSDNYRIYAYKIRSRTRIQASMQGQLKFIREMRPVHLDDYGALREFVIFAKNQFDNPHPPLFQEAARQRILDAQNPDKPLVAFPSC